ncbi:MAG TPA: pitrilysin family protein [Aggregatilineales bacterium]|nr:insulinase family protein [Anaerolineales bacterium]HRE48353.1 pitrilysin family protein [Aggregatilineales bacterium]
MSDLQKIILSNGLTVLLKPMHTAPVISFWVLYRIGSRNEPTGLTGVSHWVEHMLFKGTEQFPAGYLDAAIDREGGEWNAQTSYDYTAYYETMPAERIDLALRAEADRMVNATFHPEDVESERTVILSERRGSENSHWFWLTEDVHGAMFRVHGYRHKIIGDTHDLLTMTRDDLYNHYRRHYTPANAIIGIAGDFESEAMAARIRELYEGLPGGERPSLFARPEPPQQGERRLRVERPGPTHALMIAYRAPAVTDPDWLHLLMLDAILDGASIPGGGSAGGRTARLYQALVKTEIAVSVGTGLNETHDPYMYSFSATAREGRTLEEVETAIYGVIDGALRGELTQAELDRARKQIRALLAYNKESITNQAFKMAYFEHVAGDPQWHERAGERLLTITLDDVHRAAQKYLRPSQRTVGYFIPTNADDQIDESALEEIA